MILSVLQESLIKKSLDNMISLDEVDQVLNAYSDAERSEYLFKNRLHTYYYIQPYYLHEVIAYIEKETGISFSNNIDDYYEQLFDIMNDYVKENTIGCLVNLESQLVIVHFLDGLQQEVIV